VAIKDNRTEKRWGRELEQVKKAVGQGELIKAEGDSFFETNP